MRQANYKLIRRFVRTIAGETEPAKAIYRHVKKALTKAPEGDGRRLLKQYLRAEIQMVERGPPYRVTRSSTAKEDILAFRDRETNEVKSVWDRQEGAPEVRAYAMADLPHAPSEAPPNGAPWGPPYRNYLFDKLFADAERVDLSAAEQDALREHREFWASHDSEDTLKL